MLDCSLPFVIESVVVYLDRRIGNSPSGQYCPSICPTGYLVKVRTEVMRELQTEAEPGWVEKPRLCDDSQHFRN